MNAEKVFDLLGWGEGINQVFAGGGFFPNQLVRQEPNQDNFWELRLELKENKQFEGRDVSAIQIYTADNQPLQLSLHCSVCADTVAAHYTLDDVYAIKAVLEEALSLSI